MTAPWRMAQSVEGVEQRRCDSRLSGRRSSRKASAPKKPGLGAYIKGYPSRTTCTSRSSWRAAGSSRATAARSSSTKETAKRNHIKLGDTVTLKMGEQAKDDWQVIGLYKLVFGGSFSVDESLCAAGRAVRGDQKVQPGRADVCALQRAAAWTRKPPSSSVSTSSLPKRASRWTMARRDAERHDDAHQAHVRRARRQDCVHRRRMAENRKVAESQFARSLSGCCWRWPSSSPSSAASG